MTNTPAPPPPPPAPSSQALDSAAKVLAGIKYGLSQREADSQSSNPPSSSNYLPPLPALQLNPLAQPHSPIESSMTLTQHSVSQDDIGTYLTAFSDEDWAADIEAE